MGRFKKAADQLRSRGLFPAALALGGATATYTTIQGFTWRHLAASFVAGALCFLGLFCLLLAQSGHWIGNRSERVILDGVEASGVDTTSLSAADLKARLSYTPDEGRMLVDATSDGKKQLVDILVNWLRSMEMDRRMPATQTVLKLASSMGASHGKFELANALLEIDDTTANSLGGSTDISLLLRKFAALPSRDRRTLIEANFPVRPSDEIRVRLWETINAPTFPATDLVTPLADLAMTHASRLNAIREYVHNGSPLPNCKAVACTPTYCQSILARGYTCAPGFYLTEQAPICVSLPR